MKKAILHLLLIGCFSSFSQNYLEPEDGYFSQSPFEDYWQLQYKRLLKDSVYRDYALEVFVNPSFQPEYSVSVYVDSSGRHSLTYRLLSENLWYSRNRDSVRCIQYELPIDSLLAASLSELIQVATFQLMRSNNQLLRRDGTRYHFVSHAQGGGSGFTWSPYCCNNKELVEITNWLVECALGEELINREGMLERVEHVTKAYEDNIDGVLVNESYRNQNKSSGSANVSLMQGLSIVNVNGINRIATAIDHPELGSLQDILAIEVEARLKWFSYGFQVDLTGFHRNRDSLTTRFSSTSFATRIGYNHFVNDRKNLMKIYSGISYSGGSVSFSNLNHLSENTFPYQVEQRFSIDYYALSYGVEFDVVRKYTIDGQGFIGISFFLENNTPLSKPYITLNGDKFQPIEANTSGLRLGINYKLGL